MANVRHSCLARLWLVAWAAACCQAACLPARGEEELRYAAGKFEAGELKYIDHVPVLIVAGTPQQIGRQKAALLGTAIRQVGDYPRRLLKLMGHEDRWPRLVELGRQLLPQFPPDDVTELRAFADGTHGDRDLGIVANTLADTYRGVIGCSSLLVEPSRSATGGPLFGRNLDFFALGILDKYTLVTVYRPQGKHAFAAVGFPGVVGCLSGMNDAGLALAVHEVYLSHDGATSFNPKGVPYTLAFRRVLEECGTIAEAEKLLREMPRTTLLNLAVCDARQAVVFELTPKTVAVRQPENGLCACTNHFRTRELSVLPLCRRYSGLIKAQAIDKLTVADVTKKLDEVNQGRLTVQSMVFETAVRKLHLAIGPAPSSAQPYREIDLAPLFKP